MSNYRILRVKGINRLGNSEQWLKKNNITNESSYEDIIANVEKSAVFYTNAFSDELIARGHESKEFWVDFELLQKKWAQQNGIKFSTSNWMVEILIAQILRFKPDVIYFQGAEWFLKDRLNKNCDFLKTLKNECPSVKKTILYSGYPTFEKSIKNIDLLFCSPPSICNFYKKRGLKPILLYHAFDKNILNRISTKNKRRYDFTFAGSLRAPESRYWMIRKLMSDTSLLLWTKNDSEEYDLKFFMKTFLKNNLHKKLLLFNNINLSRLLPKKLLNTYNIFLDSKYYRYNLFEHFTKVKSLSKAYPLRCNEPVYGIEMYKLLSDSLVTFNMHTDKTINEVANIRMFEATGVGACLITDDGKNLKDLFEKDSEVVTYSNYDEANEKISYLLNNPNQALQIARAAQSKTLKKHTIGNRVEVVDHYIQGIL